MKHRATTAKELAPALLAQRLQGSRTMMFRRLKRDEWGIKRIDAHSRREPVLRNLLAIVFVFIVKLLLLLGKAPLQTTHAQETKAVAPEAPLAHTQQARLTASDGTANDNFGHLSPCWTGCLITNL